MGSNPIIGTPENAIFQGRLVSLGGFNVCESSRTETNQNTVYLPRIRQVLPTKFRISLTTIFTSTGIISEVPPRTSDACLDSDISVNGVLK
jgi:hypothetical protein